MVGALISIPRDGYVIVGMVVPESVPVLELRSLVVEDEASNAKIMSMSSLVTARAITSGETIHSEFIR